MIPRDRSPLLNSSFMLGGQLAAKGTLLVSMMILSQYLGDFDFGVLALAIALGQILFFATDMGVSFAINRRLSVEPSDRRHLLGAASAVRAILAAASIAVLAAASAAFYMDLESLAVMILVGIGYCFDSFAELGFALFRSSERMWWESSSRTAGGLAGIGVVVLVTALDLGVVAAAAAYCLRALVSLVVASVAARKSGAGLAPRPDRGRMTSLMRESWPLGVMGLVIVAWQRLDNVILGIGLGPQAVGAWQECFRILDTLVLLVTPTLLPGALFPALCRAWSESRERFESALRGIAQLVTGLSLLSALFILAGSLDLLRMLWGPGFLRGEAAGRMSSTMVMMAVSIPLVFWMNALLASLLATGRQKIVTLIACAGLALSVMLNASLLGSLGIAAPAVALAASNLLMCILIYRAMRGGRPLRIFGRMHVALVPLVPAGALLALLQGADPILRILAPTVSYGAVWAAMGGLGPLLRRPVDGPARHQDETPA